MTRFCADIGGRLVNRQELRRLQGILDSFSTTVAQDAAVLQGVRPIEVVAELLQCKSSFVGAEVLTQPAYTATAKSYSAFFH